MRCGKAFLNHLVHSPFLLPPSFPCTSYSSTNLYFPHLVGSCIAAPSALAPGRKVPSLKGFGGLNCVRSIPRSPFSGNLLCGLKKQVWIGRMKWFCKLVCRQKEQEFPRILSVGWQRTSVIWADDLVSLLWASEWIWYHLPPCGCSLVQHLAPRSWVS